MNLSSNKKGSSFNLSPSQDQNIYSSDEFSSPQGFGQTSNKQGNDSFDSPVPIKKPIQGRKQVSHHQIESLNDRESVPKDNQLSQKSMRAPSMNQQPTKQDQYNVSFRNPNMQNRQNDGVQQNKMFTLEEVQKLLNEEASKHEEQHNQLVGQIYGLNEQNKILRKELTISQHMQETLLHQMEQVRQEKSLHSRAVSQDDFFKREEEFRQAILHQDDAVRLDKWLDALKKVEKMRKQLKEQIRTLCNTNNQSILRVNAKDLTYESKGALSPQKCQIVYPNQQKSAKSGKSTTTYGKQYNQYLKSKYQKIDEKQQASNALLLQKGQPTQTVIHHF